MIYLRRNSYFQTGFTIYNRIKKVVKKNKNMTCMASDTVLNLMRLIKNMIIFHIFIF